MKKQLTGGTPLFLGMDPDLAMMHIHDLPGQA